MRFSHPVLSLTLILAYVARYASAVSLVLTALHRFVDLSSSGSRVVHDRYMAQLHNTGDTPNEFFKFTIPHPRNARLAKLTALQSPSTTALILVDESIEDNGVLYTFRLASQILPAQSGTVEVKAAFMDDMSPLPKSISQSESQQMLFLDSFSVAHLPYPTNKLTVTVELPTPDRPISYSKNVDPVSVRSSTIVYGPIVPSEWEAKDQSLRIHFMSPKVGLITDSWRREVWIRMFGQSVEVEEHVKVTYDGARLKGQFSRLKYMKSYSNMYSQAVIPRFPIPIAGTAREVYFKDEIGNVSTSVLSTIQDQRMLEIQPRFPLFGGWSYNWFHGYAMDSSEVVSFDVKSGRTLITVPLVQTIPSVAIRDLQFSLVLPEGAQDIHVMDAHLRRPVDEYEVATTYYYFDTTGRPTVTINRKNIVSETVPEVVVVSYSLHPFRRLQKATATLSFVVVLLALVLGIRSLDFNLLKKNASARQVLIPILTKRDNAVKKLCAAITAFHTTHDLSPLRNTQSVSLQILASTLTALKKILAELELAIQEPNVEASIHLVHHLVAQITDLEHERQEVVLEAVDCAQLSTDAHDVAAEDCRLLMSRESKVSLEVRGLVKQLQTIS